LCEDERGGVADRRRPLHPKETEVDLQWRVEHEPDGAVWHILEIGTLQDDVDVEPSTEVVVRVHAQPVIGVTPVARLAPSFATRH
jgi:hypothetical protein